jgi:uncharacterized protein YuzE
MTKWTYDDTVMIMDKIISMAAIHLIPPDDTREVRTLDLMGAHVFMDVDAEGNIVSIEILGPAVFVDLKNLGEYLKEPPTELKAEE